MSENKVKLFFNQLNYLKNSNDRILIRSNLVKKFLGELRNVSILDIGCGDGSLSLQFLSQDNSVTFVDISEKMLEKVKERIPMKLSKKTRLINSPFESIVFKEKFDVIICVGVIAHVPSVVKLFKKINDVLIPNGLLVLETTPNPYPIGKILYPYYFLRNLLLGDHLDYKKNRLKISSLMDITKSMNLILLESVKYSFPLPGMSHWPDSIKLKYTLFTLNNAFMSRLGSENVFLFRKNKKL